MCASQIVLKRIRVIDEEVKAAFHRCVLDGSLSFRQRRVFDELLRRLDSDGAEHVLLSIRIRLALLDQAIPRHAQGLPEYWPVGIVPVQVSSLQGRSADSVHRLLLVLEQRDVSFSRLDHST